MGPPHAEERNEEDAAAAAAAAAVTGPRGPAHTDISAQVGTGLLVGRNRRVAALPAASIPEVTVLAIAVLFFFL